MSDTLSDPKVVTAVRKDLMADGYSRKQAQDYIEAIGARRIKAWRKYGKKVAQAKAGKRVEFEARHTVKYDRKSRKSSKPARKPARKTPPAPPAVAQ